MIGPFSIRGLILFTAAACLLAGPPPAQASNPELKLLLVLDGEAAGDEFGACVTGLRDINGDGYDDFLVGSSPNDAGGANTGRVYVYLGGPVVDGTPDLVITGPTTDAYQGIGAAAGDVNGDGYDDFLVGAWGYAGRVGRAWLYLGGPVLSGTPYLVFNGESSWSMFGNQMVALEDVNNDTHDDFLIMAPWWGGYYGRGYVYFGGPGLDNVPDLVFNAPAGGEFGVQTAQGRDYNGDGFGDMLIGAYKCGNGKCWLYTGGPGLDGSPDMTFNAGVTIGWFSSPLRPGGDVNGDGYEDFFSGERAPYNDAVPGRAYLYYGGPGVDNTADLVLSGEVADDGYGAATGVGDLNGDGYDDFVVGANNNDEAGSDAGKVYVYYGGADPDVVPEITVTGEAAGDRYGITVEALGDINGDGKPDFVVDAYHHDTGGENAGRVYIYTLERKVALDIKPTSCPNPLNLKPFLRDMPANARIAKGGVLPAAILGTGDFDVADIDPESVLLEGVAPIRWGFEDVSRPAPGDEECACSRLGPDGHADMTLKFRTAELVEAIGTGPFDDTIVLTLTGEMLDGSEFTTSDCVKILHDREEPPIVPGPSSVSLGAAVPNPFNPVARIGFTLPDERYVTLSVYDVTGRQVTRLVDGVRSAGEHVVEWNAAGMPSGVYYYRMAAGDFAATRRMILLK